MHVFCVPERGALTTHSFTHTSQNTPGHPSLSVFLSGSRCCHPVIILRELETRQCLPGPLRVQHNFRRCCHCRRCSCVSSSPWVLACSLPASRSSAWVNIEVLHKRSVTGGCQWVHTIHISSWMILTEELWVTLCNKCALLSISIALINTECLIYKSNFWHGYSLVCSLKTQFQNLLENKFVSFYKTSNTFTNH